MNTLRKRFPCLFVITFSFFSFFIFFLLFNLPSLQTTPLRMLLDSKIKVLEFLQIILCTSILLHLFHSSSFSSVLDKHGTTSVEALPWYSRKTFPKDHYRGKNEKSGGDFYVRRKSLVPTPFFVYPSSKHAIELQHPRFSSSFRVPRISKNLVNFSLQSRLDIDLFSRNS